jgi:hypothetical protein
MIILYFLVAFVFVPTVVAIMYQNQRKYAALLKQHDKLVFALYNLMHSTDSIPTYSFPDKYHSAQNEARHALGFASQSKLYEKACERNKKQY